LPQIRVEIREEFRTSSGPSDSGENPPPVTIHTWLERFNKQKPRSFKKATAPCFLRLAGFLGAAVGTEEEQAKNFQWGLC
nr:zinc finger, CCHC-type, retrotransposon Gag domain protein [Tanacetum cinerariifolium]